MIDLEEINTAITELENAKITYNTCDKLASLYLIRYFTENTLESSKNDVIQREYDDINTEYLLYKEQKQKYQLGKLSETELLNSTKSLCKEIYEFLHIIYVNSDLEAERKEFIQIIKKISTLF